MTRRALIPFAIAGVIAVACEPVDGTSRSIAPLNACPEFPCDAYPAGRTQAKCQTSGRCESAGVLDTFTIVVSVPDSSFLAPGFTFLVSSDDYNQPKPPLQPSCHPPQCLPLPNVAEATGAYFVTHEGAQALGVSGIVDTASIPTRLSFVPQIASGVEATSLGLPAGPIFASSVVFNDNSLRYDSSIPAGKYLRMAYPEPPFDVLFPPILDAVTVPTGILTDEFTLDNSIKTVVLDDPTGVSRTAEVTRAQGLEGFRMWLAETKTKRRVSVIRPLHGTSFSDRLDTVRQNKDGTTALRDNISIVVAPPSSWIAVPTFESEILGGGGKNLATVTYPELPLPKALSGVVASSTDAGTLVGVPSRVTFDSTTLDLASGARDQRLHYTTTVSSDASGRFATVVPPGVYQITLEPAEGTGYSKTRQTVEVGATQLVLQPPKRSATTGRAMLSDGRPLASATVVATPTRDSSDALVPRGGQTITAADGSFRLDLDLGTYVIAVVPEDGTGFARTVSIHAISAEEAPLGDLVVPPPAKLAFTVKAFSVTDVSRSQPIANAFVRIFGDLGQTTANATLYEIGRATTDDTGKCEILLAQQPR